MERGAGGSSDAPGQPSALLSALAPEAAEGLPKRAGKLAGDGNQGKLSPGR